MFPPLWAILGVLRHGGSCEEQIASMLTRATPFCQSHVCPLCVFVLFFVSAGGVAAVTGVAEGNGAATANTTANIHQGPSVEKASFRRITRKSCGVVHSCRVGGGFCLRTFSIKSLKFWLTLVWRLCPERFLPCSETYFVSFVRRIALQPEIFLLCLFFVVISFDSNCRKVRENWS